MDASKIFKDFLSHLDGFGLFGQRQPNIQPSFMQEAQDLRAALDEQLKRQEKIERRVLNAFR